MALNLLHTISVFFSLILLLHSSSIHAHEDAVTTSGKTPFNVIALDGVQKGTDAKGINTIKKFLERFGYLQYSPKAHHANDDYFDGAMEKAVKVYQENFHLKPTGQLDKKTLSEMMKARCGVPDVVNGTNVMQRPYTGPNSRSLRLVSHYSFFPGQPKWRPAKRRLTYNYMSNTPTWAIPAMDAGYQSWSRVSPFTFVKVPTNSPSDLKAGFFAGNHGDGYPFDGPGRTLAHAFSPEDGRLHMDSQENWSIGPKQGAYDTQTTTAHEVGHNLGLDHSNIYQALMYPTTAPGTARGIHQDDVNGLRFLYGY